MAASSGVRRDNLARRTSVMVCIGSTSEPTRQGIHHMSVTRTLTAMALAAATTIGTTALVVAPAHAGGAPDLGTVTVDRQARLHDGVVTLQGTYTCTVPDSQAHSGPGTLGLELVTRSGAATTTPLTDLVPVTCDGTQRSWTVSTAAGSLRQGRAWVHSHLEVPDAAGNTPWTLFDTTVAVVGRR